MLLKLPDTDARVQPMAYITDGTALFEVIKRRGQKVVIENCRSLVQITAKSTALAKYKLVKNAPREFEESVDSPS